ncbi:MAG TPA: hypothetical protein VK173_02900 [Lacibacter sp.]|nr:hypothetical protein [Lacibacter sp.]
MKLTCLISVVLLNHPSKYRQYFEFDELDHYSIRISHDKEIKLIERDSLSSEEIRLNDVLLQPERTKLADTTNLIGLEKIGFAKKKIHPSKFQAINSLFSEKQHNEILSAACIPFYRDILIFRSKGKIVGTAKICFECNFHVIAGANMNTDDFGQSGDYERLYQLLYSGSKTVK